MGLLVTRKRLDELSARDLNAWVDLFPSNALSSTLFMHPDFCRLVHRIVSPVEVVVLEDQGRIVGVVPLARAQGLTGRIRGYGQVAQEISDGFCFPVEDAYVDTLGSALLKAGVWSIFVTHFTVGRRIPNVNMGAVTKTYAVRSAVGMGNLWDQLKERSKKFWSDTERCVRRLNEFSGGYQFHWNSPAPERDLAILIDLKLEQYRRTNQYKAPLFQKDLQELLKALVMMPTGKFSAPLSVLYCGDKLVAAHLGLSGGGRLHYWFPVYDPAYSKYSPGKILLSEVMKHSEAQSVAIIDFGEGYADYKVAVSNEVRELCKATISSGVLGAISMLPLRLAWRFGG